MKWVIGDVHGNYKILMKLLGKLNIDESKDEVYFVGDFFDRAPTEEEQLEVLKWYNDKFNNEESCYKTVRGNHDIDKYNKIKDALHIPEDELVDFWGEPISRDKRLIDIMDLPLTKFQKISLLPAVTLRLLVLKIPV